MSAIVIEGIDASGKTTLAQEFVKHGYRYIHVGKPEPDEDLFDTYFHALVQARTENIVYDRLHVGELVYGPVMRNKSLITVEQLRLLNRVLYAAGGCVIFCRPSFESCRAHWRIRLGKEYVQDEDRFEKLDDLYTDILHHEFQPMFPVLEYDYTEGPFAMGNVAKLQHLPPEVNGCPGARFLVVGERPGGLGNEAFCTMVRSSGFLNTCLWAAGYAEHELSFTNSFSVDGTRRDLMNIWMTMEKPIVIAAGKVAHVECTRQGVPHLEIAHPQYVKRFHLSKWREYVRQLKKFRRTE